MGTIRHFEFLFKFSTLVRLLFAEVLICASVLKFPENWLTLHRDGDLMIFKMAAVRHPEFLEIGLFVSCPPLLLG